MPRSVNPGLITTGPGASVPSGGTDTVLTGGSMAGAPPNVGVPGHVIPGTTTVTTGFPAAPADAAGAATAALGHHVNAVEDAHPATAISFPESVPVIVGNNVYEVINELAATVAPEPPKIGEYLNYMTLSGVPDWGYWKLNDSPAGELGGSLPTAATHINTAETGTGVFPFWWNTPTPTSDAGFTAGVDPSTDPLWNYSSYGASTTGQSRAGAYTSPVDGATRRTRLTRRYVSGVVNHPCTTVSGVVYPADRGVLAVIHWPVDASIPTFLAQDLLDRCWAAISLGQGLGASCIDPTIEGYQPGDGDPGGIFEVGSTDGVYDPFAYPGRATGQYDLVELHTGTSRLDGAALPAPWNVAQKRTFGADQIPAAGQVRLGTDAAAGSGALYNTALNGFGIPILGGTQNAYTPVASLNTLGGANGRYWGHALIPVTAGPTFWQRLPYLDDYSQATGLKYTPRSSGSDYYTTRETGRYYNVGGSAFSTNTTTSATEAVGASTVVKQAGNYPNFTQDYWNWQLARYRSILFDVAAATVQGSLWMVHFKKEADFESFVRAGVMPWDLTNGYEVYGISLVDTATTPDSTGNTINELSAPSENFAPDYGYGSASYHTLRRDLYVVPAASIATVPTVGTKTWSYAINVGTPFMWCSGVAYFIPNDNATGAESWVIDSISVSATNVWVDGFRTDDLNLTTAASPTDPAVISSPSPAVIGLSPFAYEGSDSFTDGVWASSSDNHYTLPVTLTDARGSRKQRIEFPFNKLGAYSEAVGPVNAGATTLAISMGGGDVIDILGDPLIPAFSVNAAPKLFIRRPLTTSPIQPVASGYVGTKLNHTAGAAIKVLFHSTNAWLDDNFGDYGNFYSGADNRAFDGLSTATKDSQELFLDEVYRYDPALADPYLNAIIGPGMAGWVGGPIPIHVQAGVTTTTPFKEWSWFKLGFVTASLAASDLQVAGLPDRNPPIESWVTEPFPSAGVLRYPSVDYTSNTRPNIGETGVAQPNYSAAAGLRDYTRVFDAAFVRTADPEPTAGQQNVALRIDGIDLNDFSYTAPGPGQTAAAANNSGIAIFVKVPGQTAWMDLGRVDGDGPGKQDNAVDGAGCKVLGTYTFSAIDPTTGMVYSQVLVNLGPVAALANGYDTTGAGDFEVPVMVKVQIQDPAVTALSAKYNLEFPKTNLTIDPTTFGAADPAAYPWKVRGITGIRVIRPSELSEITAAQTAAWTALNP